MTKNPRHRKVAMIGSVKNEDAALGCARVRGAPSADQGPEAGPRHPGAHPAWPPTGPDVETLTPAAAWRARQAEHYRAGGRPDLARGVERSDYAPAANW